MVMCLLTYIMLAMRRNLFEWGFGKAPSGLTTVGIPLVGRAEAAHASTISEIFDVTNSWCSNPDLEVGIYLETGGVVSHTRSYPLSIDLIAHLLLTKVLQKGAHFEMLPVVMGSEPAGS